MSVSSVSAPGANGPSPQASAAVNGQPADPAPKVKTSDDESGPKIAAPAKLPPNVGKNVDIHA